jgi:hypothetical protein
VIHFVTPDNESLCDLCDELPFQVTGRWPDITCPKCELIHSIWRANGGMAQGYTSAVVIRHVVDRILEKNGANDANSIATALPGCSSAAVGERDEG